MERNPAARDALPIPVHARIIQHPFCEIDNDFLNPASSPKAVEKRQFIGRLCRHIRITRRRRGRRIRIGFLDLGFLNALFAASLAGAGQLFSLSHALAGALIRFTTSRSEEIGVCFLGGGSVAAACRHRNNDKCWHDPDTAKFPSHSLWYVISPLNLVFHIVYCFSLAVLDSSSVKLGASKCRGSVAVDSLGSSRGRYARTNALRRMLPIVARMSVVVVPVASAVNGINVPN